MGLGNLMKTGNTPQSLNEKRMRGSEGWGNMYNSDVIARLKPRVEWSADTPFAMRSRTPPSEV